MENNIAGIPIEDLKPLAIKYEGNDSYESLQNIAVKISVARAARLSYMTFEGKIDYVKDIALHDQLLAAKHASPFEHCAKAMTDLEYYSFYKGEYPVGIENDGDIYNMESYPKHYKHYKGEHGWCDNFKGFISYRHLISQK
jgi:hypothetical protein